MRKILTSIFLFFITMSANAQVVLDNNTIEDIVKNEQQYYNDILKLYLSDDPFLRVDDIALIYYGQAYTPHYNPGHDENEKALKKYHDEGNSAAAYNTAKKIFEYNPVSLNALFNLLTTAKSLNKSDEEYNSYAKKYMGILNMIVQYGDGKSSKTAFRVISPDDQNYVLYHQLGVEKEVSRDLDTGTLCSIVIIEPTPEFQARRIYFDLSLFLKHTSK